ncbi:MAG TPA: hypothetical protein VGE85_01460 [Terracidiphilus sp.]|jgi:hypothetical protein
MPKGKASRLHRWFYFFGLYLTVAAWCPSVWAQSAEEMMGVSEGHCSVGQGTVDGKTYACIVWDHDPVKFSSPTQLEIYRNRKRIYTIEPGSPIREWHFWREDKQLAVHYGTPDGPGTYALYDTLTGVQVERLPGSPQPRRLPQWTKSQWQLAEESLPEGPAFSQQQTVWIGKVLREIDTVRPGMTRKDLLKVFAEEGGLSTRTQRTYVYKDCPFIKVDAVFRAVGAVETWESGEDQLISISRPYLAYSIMD